MFVVPVPDLSTKFIQKFRFRFDNRMPSDNLSDTPYRIGQQFPAMFRKIFTQIGCAYRNEKSFQGADIWPASLAQRPLRNHRHIFHVAVFK